MNWDEVQRVTATKLEQFDLHRDANKASATFSGGMKRRLSVGLASVGNPKFIVLDEPTSTPYSVFAQLSAQFYVYVFVYF